MVFKNNHRAITIGEIGHFSVIAIMYHLEPTPESFEIITTELFRVAVNKVIYKLG
jgi:hypothetical protein